VASGAKSQAASWLRRHHRRHRHGVSRKHPAWRGGMALWRIVANRRGGGVGRARLGESGSYRGASAVVIVAADGAHGISARRRRAHLGSINAAARKYCGITANRRRHDAGLCAGERASARGGKLRARRAGENARGATTAIANGAAATRQSASFRSRRCREGLRSARQNRGWRRRSNRARRHGLKRRGAFRATSKIRRK